MNWSFDSSEENKEYEQRRKVKHLLKQILLSDKNTDETPEISIDLNKKYIPVKFTFDENKFFTVFNEFDINYEHRELFVSLKINNCLNELTDLEINKEINIYANDIKKLFGIRCKPKVKRFSVLSSLSIVHIVYSLPKKAFNDLIASAEMLIAINHI